MLIASPALPLHADRGGQVQRGGAKKKGGPGAVVITKKDRGRK